MKIWLDTIDIDAIRKAQAMGVLAGVTTNPSILATSNRDVEAVLGEILDAQSGPLAVQVAARGLDGMLAQARRIAGISPRMVVKIPAAGDGFRAMSILEREGIATLATTIFETRQLALAALAGASYAAPYVNRIELSTGNAFEVLEQSQRLLDAYGYKTSILAAAVKTVDQFLRCAQTGVAAVTLPVAVFQQLHASSEDIEQSLRKFDAAWQSNGLTRDAALFKA
ncbi:transaldolase family protein [Chromobacterium piscinae]|uniref:Transaldolase family protein n=1 Tax=Chromobacterium piscinae TaxID=686831 RepID=A0ABV0H2I3_9NEIS|nr:hypothetical protein [Chromobacterium vaccinii]MBX9356141.1 hypothetical protein [Chromobacterium vaccinii]NHQ83234.1 fructose-6-phosphate aldolase [Chromobacterium vaccinii]